MAIVNIKLISLSYNLGMKAVPKVSEQPNKYRKWYSRMFKDEPLRRGLDNTDYYEPSKRSYPA